MNELFAEADAQRPLFLGREGAEAQRDAIQIGRAIVGHRVRRALGRLQRRLRGALDLARADQVAQQELGRLVGRGHRRRQPLVQRAPLVVVEHRQHRLAHAIVIGLDQLGVGDAAAPRQVAQAQRRQRARELERRHVGGAAQGRRPHRRAGHGQQLRDLLGKCLRAKSLTDVGRDAPRILYYGIDRRCSDSKRAACELTHLTSSVTVDFTALRATARAFSRGRLRVDAGALSA